MTTLIVANGSAKPQASSALLRLKSILAPNGPIPVGKSTWWDGVRSGRFPKPVKLGPRTTVWRQEDVQSLIDNAPLSWVEPARSK
ncbi:AlpA family phage regulatory protein [Mesorhizobium sp.]|uniref:helix-turn-helix transcriptional regulator n=1 Tax=Mesorhizobium sp. TaxID=1871066 RepID=UPI0012294CD7|nr:AlpA family phage regulatory protein [Mesorhizobium sp.]TIM05487.1 MAG: AlpA family phage regulatory protein [Mesorhizobium sp.]